MKNITILGASGFLGRHVVRRLATTGAVIRVPTRNPEKALALKPMGGPGQIVPILCHPRNDASVTNAIGAPDAVLNLVGILYERGQDTFQALHVEAAARIARVARERGARTFIHVSALGANATSPSSYARSKANGEQAVRAFFPEATILRPSLVFGPEDDFFNRFAAWSCVLPFLPLIGGGTTRFQPVYAGDVAEACLRALQNPNAQGRTYELGGPQTYSFRELLEMVLTLTGRRTRLLDIPWGMAKMKAALLNLLPRPPLTPDQVELLKTDNVLRGSAGIGTLQDLGIAPTALEIILPTYLGRFRLNRESDRSPT